MPIYAYKCADCGHEQEVLQKISDAPLTDCPDCGHPALAKQVTAAGFQLKGSGWYATDFRNKDSGGKGKPAGDKTDGSKTDGGKTDGSKTESAKDSKADGGTSAPGAAASQAGGSGGCASCS